MASLKLSEAELNVLHLLAHGLQDKQIAAVLCRSIDTVQCHRDHLFAKTDCHNRVELTRYAIDAGLVPPAWKRDRAK